MLSATTLARYISLLAAGIVLGACGGGGSDPAPPPAPVTYTIGGTVSGLTGTGLVLQNNAGNNFTVTASGTFTFSTAINSGAAYAVTVLTQPTGQTCAVASGSGTATANVTSVAVTCSATTPVTRTIGGSVSGLTGTVVLQNNGGNNLSVAANGSFTFSTAINTGAAYAVTVLTQPAGQTCTVASGSGTASANVTNVAVTCATATTTTATIGGGITGMTSSGLVLRLSRNGTVVETLPALAANANSFAFTTQLSTGDTWAVSVVSQPNTPLVQGCVVAGGSGTIAASSVSTVQLTCTTVNVAITGTVTIASGTLAAGLVLQNRFADDLAIPAGGTTTNFQFSTLQTLPSNYNISIKTQPTGQTCAITRGLGYAGLGLGAGGQNIQIKCVNRRTVNALSGTYGLSVAGSPLRAFVTFFLDGTYVFGIRNDGGAQCGVGGNSGNGVEYGVYDFNAAAQTLTWVSAVIDTNGDCGINDSTAGIGSSGTGMTKNGAGVIAGTFTYTADPPEAAVFTPVPSTSGQLLGAWGANTGNTAFTVYGNDNTIFFANSQAFQNTNSAGQYDAGIEDACFVGAGPTAASGSYTVSFANTCLPLGKVALDTNGPVGGFSGFGSTPVNFVVAGDTVTNTVGTNPSVSAGRIVVN